MIALQGIPGAYSDLACRRVFPHMPTLPCPTFERAIEAVRTREAELDMLACQNNPENRRSKTPGSPLHRHCEHSEAIQSSTNPSPITPARKTGPQR